MNIKNEQGGFLQLIIGIVIAVFILQYFGYTIYDVVDWFKAVF